MMSSAYHDDGLAASNQDFNTNASMPSVRDSAGNEEFNDSATNKAEEKMVTRQEGSRLVCIKGDNSGNDSIQDGNKDLDCEIRLGQDVRILSETSLKDVCVPVYLSLTKETTSPDEAKMQSEDDEPWDEEGEEPESPPDPLLLVEVTEDDLGDDSLTISFHSLTYENTDQIKVAGSGLRPRAGMTRARRPRPTAKTHRCSSCARAFTSRRSLTTHTRRECPTTHRAREERVETLECPKCGKTFWARGRLTAHVNHECGRDLRCPKCDKLFPSASYLKTHVNHECGRDLACPQCRKAFATKGQRDKHVKHEWCREQRCPRCSKVFKNKVVLTAHVENVCAEEVACAACGKFCKQQNLDAHVKYECGRELRCPACLKVFKFKGGLTFHVNYECRKEPMSLESISTVCESISSV